MSNWTPFSWKQFSSDQMIHYPCDISLAKATSKLETMPPLVTVNEISQLKMLIREAALGKCFLLQGGDCAESFADCNVQLIESKYHTLTLMSLILSHGLNKPVVRIGRIAGQFAKPRSALVETINQETLPSYRGDLINQHPFSLDSRTPNPKLMIQGYQHAAITMNYIRTLTKSSHTGIFDSLKKSLKFYEHNKELRQVLTEISSTLQLLNKIHYNNKSPWTSDFFTSHEALNLFYESALTRLQNNSWYNLSTHFPWVGYRSAKTNSAHIEYLRGIENPVAIKVGPTTEARELIELSRILNPNNMHGKLTFVTRLGKRNVSNLLPTLIRSVQKAKLNVLWLCDPMHGNTYISKTGLKTRSFTDIFDEMDISYKIHIKEQSRLGGIHLELTGEDVTECIGGVANITEDHLSHNYRSLVDPRLNFYQSTEIAFYLAKAIRAYTRQKSVTSIRA